MSKKLCVLFLFVPLVAIAEDFTSYMDTETIGAKRFIEAHPSWDGRGVVIAVLDTGVDTGVMGLLKTSTQETKVIEARDFTGENVVQCHEARMEGDWFVTSEGRVKGIRKTDSPVFIGFLREETLKNSSISDLNSDGDSKDRFAVVLVKEGAQYVVFVDLDGDGDVSDESSHRSYAVDPKPLRFRSTMGEGKVSVTLTITASDAGAKTVEFHIPGNPHGTHVAGIASGFELFGQKGFNGIAPGAKVMSLKIGDTRLAGGATVNESMKKALEYASKWQREHNVPVVVNMSYGIGSEMEGEADIERFIDNLVQENPKLVVVVSAGNNGPGLSTVGSPASSSLAITVGALLSKKNAKDLLGLSLDDHVLFPFSSRGGEIQKPDIVAPGIASSSVPEYQTSEVFAGTSMSAPQVAGLCALLISALEHEKIPWHAGVIKRALIGSAKPLKGYSVFEQGAGIPQIEEAVRLAKELSKMPSSEILLGYQIKTTAPTGAGEKGSAVFFRTMGFFPDKENQIKVSVKPVFIKDAKEEQKKGFFRDFGLSTSDSMVKVSKSRVYIKGEREAEFEVFFEPRGAPRSGLNSGVVVARSGPDGFSVPFGFIVPRELKDDGGIPKLILDSQIKPLEVKRFFFNTPPDVGSIAIRAKPSKGKPAWVILTLYDPKGRKVYVGDSRVFSDDGLEVSKFLALDDLEGIGTYELCLFAPPQAKGTSYVEGEIAFYFLRAESPPVFSSEPGHLPTANVVVENVTKRPFRGNAQGQIVGYERIIQKEMTKDGLVHSFSMTDELSKVEFELEIAPEDFVRFTDIAVDIVDGAGKSLLSTGFSTRKLTLSFKKPSAKKEEAFRLEVKPGLALSYNKPVRMKIKERFVWSKTVEVKGLVSGQETFVIYPGTGAQVELKAQKTPLSIPGGTSLSGYIDFVSMRDRDVWLRVKMGAKGDVR